MSSVTNYQCPNCQGPLHFDSTLQKLKCDYCGSTFTNQEIETYYQDKNLKAEKETSKITKEEMGWSDEEASHLRAYSCPSCGAQIVCEETTGATSCPYCNNPTVIPAQFSGTLRPKYVIPFKLTKEDAIEKLHTFYRKKAFLPNAFTNQNHIEEIKGMYVPFWLYNASIDCHLSFHCTNTHVHSDGEYQITEISHFRCVRNGDVDFLKVPADASSKMPDEYMDAIEPFDYQEMVPFQLSYMPGYLADKYDLTAKQLTDRVNTRMENSAADAISSTVVGYSSVVPEEQNIQTETKLYEYALLPVWVLATKYKEKPYLFVMNGQTGKMVGQLPLDVGKMVMKCLLVFTLVTIVTFVLVALTY